MRSASDLYGWVGAARPRGIIEDEDKKIKETPEFRWAGTPRTHEGSERPTVSRETKRRRSC